jgi:hypothetical protein
MKFMGHLFNFMEQSPWKLIIAQLIILLQWTLMVHSAFSTYFVKIYINMLTTMGVIGDKCRIFISLVSDLYCIGPPLCVTGSMHSAALADLIFKSSVNSSDQYNCKYQQILQA